MLTWSKLLHVKIASDVAEATAGVHLGDTLIGTPVVLVPALLVWPRAGQI